MSYIFTSNMIKLRGLTWRNNVSFTATLGKTFVSTSGSSFTGYWGGSYGGYGGSYSASIMSYSPAFYISADKTELSRNDYALCDDATAVSYTITAESITDNDGVSSVVHIYYSNDTDEDVTINKVYAVGKIATSTTTGNPSYNSVLLFEELLDTPVTLAAGERWARNFEFRLEVA